jgi:hypothetical protein
MNDLLLLALFTAYVSLVITDHFLTIIGIKKGYSERMKGTKALIEKYGLHNGMKIRTLMELCCGIIIAMLYFILGSLIPCIQFSIGLIFSLLILAFLIITIINIHTLRKSNPQASHPPTSPNS